MDLSILQEIASRIFEIVSSSDTGYLIGLGSFVPNVFRGIGIGPDKVKEPAPVDYVGAAEKTSQGNLQLARQTAADNLRLAQENIKANRINQYTPYGSLTYSQDPRGNWSQRMNLTPEAQATLDKQMAMDRQYADIAQTGLTKAQKTLENPELDFSTLPQLQGIDLATLPQSPIDAGKTAQQAIMSRLQPQLQQQESELAQRLANQGITLGSEAYQREMNLAGQRRNDLELQAAAQGISLDQAARMNALNEQNMRYGNQADMRGRLLQEQAMQKDRPLNLINALRSGAQVQNPTFQPYAQQNAVMQAQTAGPDYVKAGMLGYQQGMDSYNAQQARQQVAMRTAGKIFGNLFGGESGGGMPQFTPGMFGG